MSFTIINIFSEIASPFKLYVENEKGIKLCLNGPGHMTKMAATSICGKNKIISLTRQYVPNCTWGDNGSLRKKNTGALGLSII